MNPLVFIAGLAVAYFFLPLIVGIPIVFFTQRFRKTPLIEPADLAAVDSLDHQKIEEITRSLEKEGCRPVGDFAFSIMATGKMYSRFFYESSGFIVGHLSQVQAKNVRVFLAEFASDFEDGAQLNTRNDSFPPSFKRRKNQVLRQYPMLAPALLLHAHRHNLEVVGKGKALKNIADQDVLRRIAESFRRELSQQVNMGLLRPEGDYYRTTIFGAVYMVFQQWLYMMLKINPTIARDRFVASLGTRRDKAFDADFKMVRPKTDTWKIVFLTMIFISGFNFVAHPSEKGSVLAFRLAVILIGVAGLMFLNSKTPRTR